MRVANNIYDFWAARRLKVTGRPGIEVVLEARAAKAAREAGVTCKDDVCDLPKKT